MEIKGYRKLNDEEVRLVNAIKGSAEKVGIVCDILAETVGTDQRWLAIGRTDLQKGFMALIRAVTKPTTF